MGENIAQLASAESLHQKRHVHSTFIYQSKPVKLTVGKGCESQNMLAVLFYQHNIPSTILWKLERPTSTHRFKYSVTRPGSQRPSKLVSLVNSYLPVLIMSPPAHKHTFDTYSCSLPRLRFDAKACHLPRLNERSRIAELAGL